MKPIEFLNKMKEIDLGDGDCEECHADMDQLMCDLLCDLGYEAGIRVFSNAEKWYA